ncbi:MAG: pseudouridine-5'-phosphate glycosidase, partial [Actinomycetota bacterium]
SSGHKVFYVCRLGDDAAGRVIAYEFNAWNIEYKPEFLKEHRTGIVGKAVTPFLLEYFHSNSKGESLRVNVEIIKANAALAAQIAVALK